MEKNKKTLIAGITKEQGALYYGTFHIPSVFSLLIFQLFFPFLALGTLGKET